MPDFNTNNNSGFTNLSVKTNGLNIFGSDGNMLMTSYLDDSVSIAFCYPSIDETGKKTYPKDNRITVVLRRDVVADLATILTSEKFLSAVESEGTFNQGVFLDRSRLNILSIVVEGKNVALMYFKDLNEERKPANIFVFQFQRSTIISGFNGRTDDFAVTETNASLFMFAHMISWFEATCATKLGGHMAKLGMNWNASKEMEYLRAIANKIGAQVSNSSSYGNNGYSNNSSRYPEAQASQDANATASQMQTIDNLAGFIQ